MCAFASQIPLVSDQYSVSEEDLRQTQYQVEGPQVQEHDRQVDRGGFRRAEVKVELAEAKDRGDKIIYIDESMFSYKMKEIRTW